MEKSPASYQQRSLARRLLAPLGLSLAVLGGGGWGVYHYTTHKGDDAASGIAHTAPSASEELKQLFASSPPQESGPPRWPSKIVQASDRYALVPLRLNRTPLKPTPQRQTTLRNMPVSVDSTTALLGNRYARSGCSNAAGSRT